MTMSVPSVRAKRLNLRSESKTSQASIGSEKGVLKKRGLTSRSKNMRNTPSPSANVQKLSEKVGNKILTIYRDQDENSNPPTETKSSTTPRLKSTSKDTKSAKQPTTTEIGIQVNADDIDIELDIIRESEEELSLTYYKQLAEERLRENESLSEELNSTKTDLEDMTTVNKTLTDQNEELIKRVEEVEADLEEAVSMLEQSQLGDENNSR